MNEIITINNSEILMKEYLGEKVITFNDIDEVHKSNKGIAKRNFTNNKKHLIQNEDYYLVTKNELGVNFSLSYGFGKNASTGILITESGYLMIAKSLTDDLAWKVQRQLVNTYFRAKTISSTNNNNLTLENILQTLLAHQQEQRLAQEMTNQEIIQNQQAQTAQLTALTTLITSTLPQPYNPPFTRWISKTLTQVDVIAEANNCPRKQMLHQLYNELQDTYDLDLNEYAEEYCYAHGLQQVCTP